MKKLNKKKPIIGFSIGDINGIGPEILIKSLSNKNLTNHFTPLVYCNFEIIDYSNSLFYGIPSPLLNSYNFCKNQHIQTSNYTLFI